MKYPKYLYEPDDGPAAGSDDPAPDPAPRSTAVSDDAVKAVADTIRQAIEAGRGSAAPAAVPTVDRAAIQRQLEAEALEVTDKINKLGAEGNIAEALATKDAFERRVRQSLAVPQTDDPVVKTAVALGKKLAQGAHSDIMKRWGAEVELEVSRMTTDERISPEAWDKAVTRVKANHHDELFNEAVSAAREEDRKKFTPPPSSSGRVRRELKGAAAKLSEEQLAAADACGVTAEDYAAELDREVAFDALPFKKRGPGPGYPVIDDKGAQFVTPGKF